MRGHIVTTCACSKPARARARGNPIDLIDGKRLKEAVDVIGM